MSIEKYIYVSVQHPFTYVLFLQQSTQNTANWGYKHMRKSSGHFGWYQMSVDFSSRNDFGKLAPSQMFPFLYNFLIHAISYLLYMVFEYLLFYLFFQLCFRSFWKLRELIKVCVLNMLVLYSATRAESIDCKCCS